MPVIITPAPDPATRRPAQDPQWVVRPWAHRSSDQDEAVLHWQALVDAGLIPVLSNVEGGGNPPAPPEVVARRKANDALFRTLARPHVRVRSRA